MSIACAANKAPCRTLTSAPSLAFPDPFLFLRIFCDEDLAEHTRRVRYSALGVGGGRGRRTRQRGLAVCGGYDSPDHGPVLFRGDSYADSGRRGFDCPWGRRGDGYCRQGNVRGGSRARPVRPAPRSDGARHARLAPASPRTARRRPAPLLHWSMFSSGTSPERKVSAISPVWMRNRRVGRPACRRRSHCAHAGRIRCVRRDGEPPPHQYAGTAGRTPPLCSRAAGLAGAPPERAFGNRSAAARQEPASPA